MISNKMKRFLKSKTGIAVIGSGLIITVGLAVFGYSKVTKVNQESNEVVENINPAEKEAKELLEKLKEIDVSKLSDEDKQALETKIEDIESLIKRNLYIKAKSEIEIAKTDVENKLKEVAKEENKVEETKKEENKEEVAANNTSTEATNNVSNDSTSNSTSNSNSNSNSNVSSSTNNNTSSNISSGSSSSSNQGSQPKPSTPTPTPTPQPPVVEEPKPVYPSVAEVKQRLIAYGQSLGLKYDPSITYDSADKVSGTDQMWSSEVGSRADQQTLFNGLVSGGCYAFNIEVVDLGNGFCRMDAYGIRNWD